MASPMQTAFLIRSSALLSHRRSNTVTPTRRSGTQRQWNGARAGPVSATIETVAVRSPAVSIPVPTPSPAHPALGGILESHDQAEASHNLRYSDISKLIDVERPYYALYDVSAPSTLQSTCLGMPVSGKFRTESEKGPEEHLPIGVGELGRHTAVLGSIACAAANPVKHRHYYLAARGLFWLADGKRHVNTVSPTKFCFVPELSADPFVRITKSTPVLQPHHAASTELGTENIFQAVATCHKFRGGIAKVRITIHRIAITGENEPYGSGEMTYMVCEEAAFERTLSAWTAQQGASPPPYLLFALPPGLLQSVSSKHSDISADTGLAKSPYHNPFHIVEAKDRAEDGAREGLLHFDDAQIAEGHFRSTPALPVAVVLANMVQCVSFLYSKPFTVRSLDLKCKRCAVLGEGVRFRASHLEHGIVQGSVMSAGSGEELAAFNMKLSF